jgi:hypothetical protein
MKVLSVKRPMLDAILAGLKTIEVRRFTPLRRGWLVLHASATDYSALDLSRMCEPDVKDRLLRLKGENLAESGHLTGLVWVDLWHRQAKSGCCARRSLLAVPPELDGEVRPGGPAVSHWHLKWPLLLPAEARSKIKGRLGLWHLPTWAASQVLEAARAWWPNVFDGKEAWV